MGSGSRLFLFVFSARAGEETILSDPANVYSVVSMIDISGVRSVEVNRKQSLVVVSGYVDQKRVLEEVKSTGKKAELWPYVAHDLVAYPYVPQAYDKRAPSGYVRNVPQAQADPNDPGEVLANFFNEEDPNACSIM